MSRDFHSISISPIIQRFLLLLALLGMMLLMRGPFLAQVADVGIGSDELQAVIYAANTSFSSFLKNMNLEPHPPSYYAQLYFWMKLGKGGLWLRLNPFFWSIATALMLWLIGKQLFTEKAGVLAAFIYVLLPYTLPLSIEISKYAIMFFLATALAWCVYRFFHAQRLWLAGSGVILGSLAYLYSHGAGFLILVSLNTYALLLAFSERPWKVRRLAFFGLTQIPIFIGYIPWMLRARTIGLTYPVKEVAASFSQLLFGYYLTLPPVPGQVNILGLGLFIILSILILLRRNVRWLYLSFVLAPIAACALISLSLHPIWLTRVFAPFLPLFALSLAVLIVTSPTPSQPLHRLRRYQRPVEWGVLAVLLVGVLLGNWKEYTSYAPWTPVKQPALVVLEQAEQGDIVSIPNLRMYWSTMWYILGRDNFILEKLPYDFMLPNRVRIVTLDGKITPKAGHNYWWIYRDGEDHAVFDRSDTHLRFEVVGQFENTTVERVSFNP